jgi:hypothetical protein
VDLKRVLAELQRERDALDAAIVNLERLENSRHRDPGRSPSLVAKSSTNGTNHTYSPRLETPGDE